MARPGAMKRATQAAIAQVIFGCDCDLIKPRWGAICSGSSPPPFGQPARSGSIFALWVQIWRLHHLCSKIDRRRGRPAPASGAEQSANQSGLRDFMRRTPRV